VWPQAVLTGFRLSELTGFSSKTHATFVMSRHLSVFDTNGYQRGLIRWAPDAADGERSHRGRITTGAEVAIGALRPGWR
jgi:hypothetical protein